MILDIRVLGDPILRQETKKVATVTDEHRKLIDDMFETMHTAHGIGLAAPQVGRSERIAVVEVEGMPPIALINPEIVSLDSRTEKSEEGCLSIPDVFGDIERPVSALVRALDRDGRAIEVSGTDLLARCMQHEIDHLNGKLFIDYLSLLKRKAALAQWSKTKDRYPGFIRRLTEEEVAKHHSDEEL